MQAIAQAGLPVDRFLVGTGAAALEDACRLVQGARNLGFGGALLLPPFYYKGIEASGLLAYIATLIERVGRDGLRLYLYHFPALSGVPYTFEIVTALKVQFPDVVRGLKDSSVDLPYSSRLAREVADFDVFPGTEGVLATPDAQCYAGCISATVNITSDAAGAGWHAADPEERARHLHAAAVVRDVFSAWPLFAAIKSALADRYGDPAWVRVMPPLRPLTDAERAQLRSALSQL